MCNEYNCHCHPRCENCELRFVEEDGQTCEQCVDALFGTKCNYCDNNSVIEEDGVLYCQGHYDLYGQDSIIACPTCGSLASKLEIELTGGQYCDSCLPQRCITCMNTVSEKLYGKQCYSCQKNQSMNICVICKSFGSEGRTMLKLNSDGVCENCLPNPLYRERKRELFKRYGIQGVFNQENDKE